MEEKKVKYRWWLALMLDNLAEGEQFKPGKLHVTILPWFVIDKDVDFLLESFRKTFRKLASFDISIGKIVFFGPKKDAKVNLVKPSDDLLNLHKRAMHWFGQIDARWAVKHPHVEAEYKPHIRRRAGVRLKTGERIKINSISLIKAVRAEDGRRFVAAKLDLR